MAEFAMHSFCERCGAHRRRLPFGKRSYFFDREPCHRCGEPGSGNQEIAQRVRVGRWPWQRGWVDRDGNRVDLPSPSPSKGDRQ